MKLLGIFNRKKKKSLKELYEPVIDKMWLCLVHFSPWNPNDHDVLFKEVNITEAHADKYGIYVVSDYIDSRCCSSQPIGGYIDKLEMRYNWCGFFETEESAKAAYNATMEEWIATIRSKMA